MYALAQLAMRGRLYAALVAAAFAWAAFALIQVPGAALLLLPLMPLLMYASAAVVGLTTLRNGPTEAGLVILGGGLAMAAGLLAAQMPVRHVLEVLFAFWVPTLVAGEVLRRRQDQGVAASAIAISATVVALLVLLLSGDPVVQLEAWLAKHWDEWRDMMRQSMPDAPQARMSVTPADVARAATHLMLSSWVFGVMMSMLLARWWHARMDNPGGFGREFKEFRLPRWVAFATVALMVLSFLVDGGLRTLTGTLSQVGMLLFMVQGVAVAHGVVAIRSAHVGWLVAMYLMLLVLMPMSLYAIALTGFFDHWLDYRKRAQRV